MSAVAVMMIMIMVVIFVNMVMIMVVVVIGGFGGEIERRETRERVGVESFGDDRREESWSEVEVGVSDGGAPAGRSLESGGGGVVKAETFHRGERPERD